MINGAIRITQIELRTHEFVVGLIKACLNSCLPFQDVNIVDVRLVKRRITTYHKKTRVITLAGVEVLYSNSLQMNFIRTVF